jgi:hypothetical protein
MKMSNSVGVIVYTLNPPNNFGERDSKRSVDGCQEKLHEIFNHELERVFSSRAAAPPNVKPVSVPIVTPPPPEPLPQIHRIVHDDAMLLPAGYWKSVSFTVGKRGKITGRVEAKGGIDDAIKVVITDPDGLTNLSRGNDYRGWYHSGEVSVATLDVGNLAPDQTTA